MDLSSLQHDLPRTRDAKPSPPPSLPPSSLTSDFKAAALAVTKLYQNSGRQLDHARQEGYLAAVQEVASILSAGELAGDRLREWCAVGLSRITAQEDEMNRTRHATENDEDTLEGRDDKEKELTPPTSSPVSNRALPLQNLFGDAAFTFQGPFPAHFSPYFGVPIEPEVTYEVIENGREGGGGRKRAVSHQQGSIWDFPGNKRNRHV
jgi:hypothetical protein